MWTVLKYDKKYLNLLINELKKKLGDNCKFYHPKIRYNTYINDKLVLKAKPLFGDYIMLYHEKFRNISLINELKFIKGLKYFLSGYQNSQFELINFVENFVKLEDEKGFINKNFFLPIEGKKYQFQTGPFSNKFFKLLNIEKEFLNIMLGNIKLKLKFNNYLIKPAK